MKKAIQTLFRLQSPMATLMVVFAWCCLSLSTAEAQDIVMQFKANDTTSTAVKLATCNGEVTSSSRRFIDDGKNDGNYTDPVGHFRRDTVEICPKDAWSRVKVVFTDFDLAIGDTLCAFDGTRKDVRDKLAIVNDPTASQSARDAARLIGIGSGTGVGVSKFRIRPGVNGTAPDTGAGWIDATCDPAVNPSGCLTFVFKTNGDNRKGKGFDAWVDCEERKIELSGANVTGVKLTCDSAYANVTISAPTVKGCGSGITDSVFARIKNQSGMICTDTMLAATPGGLPESFTGAYAIGQYLVEYKLKSDTTKVLNRTFSVQAPSLVCNDEIVAPLGSACAIQFVPDDLLENPCDTMMDTMYYNITITLGTGKDQQVLTTKGVDDGNAVVYPEITKDVLKKAKVSVCGGTASVKVERIYYGRTGTQSTATLCNNGKIANSCTTTIKFQDLSKPVISVAAGVDTLVACDTTGLGAIIGATATDNCDDTVDVGYTVSFDNDPCFKNDADGKPDTTRLTVNFFAVDDCGNRGTASKEFVIIRPNLAHHLAKVDDVKIDCNANVAPPLPGMKIGTYQNSTFNVKDTIELSTTEYICGYILTATDEDIPSTDCGRKLYRYYNLVDWCNPSTAEVRIDTSLVEYTDTTAPVIVGEVGTYTTNFGRTFGTLPNADIPLGPFDCKFDINTFTKPSATDNCDDNPSVRIDSIFRIEDGLDWALSGSPTMLDCDSFRIKWIVEDKCHEQLTNDTSYQIVVIKDVTKPSAVCTDELVVSVPGDEGARINIGEIDGGSSDACGIMLRELRRKGTTEPWDTFVIITCNDVHEEVQIEMRVTDTKGNQNTCWLTVTAEDKIPPVCTNLPDTSVLCTQVQTGELGTSTDADGDGNMEDSEWQPLTGDLMEVYNTRFGIPDCVDNLSCGTLVIEQQYQLIDLECGALSIRRRYRANDWKPNASAWAEQRISVVYVPDWKLTFPPNADLDCSDQMVPAAAAAADIISNGSCDKWSVEVTEKAFDVPGDICMKIERTYELINWCVYNVGDSTVVIPNATAGTMVDHVGNETVGRYQYTQVIALYVTETPVLTIDDVELCIVGAGDALPYGEEDQTPGAAPYECDTIRTFSASAVNCVGASLTDFTWKFSADGVQVATGTGASFDQVVSPGIKYTVEFETNDGCGNSTSGTKDYMFLDCKKPTPYVLNGLAIELGEDGTVQMWATDLNQGSFDNCTDQSKLEMYIGIGEPNAGPTTLEGVRALGSVITLGCDNVGTQSVSIYVVDEAGNYDVVGTYVLVQDNLSACSGIGNAAGMVAGKIVSPNGENVEQVAVSVAGAMQESMTTGADGTFQFDLNMGDAYTVTPVKDMNPLNGVSTFDLVLISKHILGITPFDSPYKYIAADVNKSGTVTAFDMVQLRQLILNITTDFANNDSWRFVDAKHDFSAVTTNPAAQNFAEFLDINNLASSMMDANFVGVKIGDVNGNAAANSLLGAESRTKNGTMKLNVADRFVEAGETVKVDFTSADITAVQGYQFTMNFAGLNFETLGEGAAKVANFNTNAARRGVIATSWNGEATADEVLFSVTFNATSNGLLSELISVSSDMTSAEAYNANGDMMDVTIEFTGSVANGFALGQNNPNPFNGETVIGFNLPKADAATLTVMDVQGKVLTEIRGDYEKGYNTVTLKASDLGATGVLYYQLESADQVATKKMIIIE
ncbi:MAG: T9SS type A sorting domain-containing protein [Bacteroidota bacterium]